MWSIEGSSGQSHGHSFKHVADPAILSLSLAEFSDLFTHLFVVSWFLLNSNVNLDLPQRCVKRSVNNAYNLVCDFSKDTTFFHSFSIVPTPTVTTKPWKTLISTIRPMVKRSRNGRLTNIFTSLLDTMSYQCLVVFARDF